jgi:hypothetical protein
LWQWEEVLPSSDTQSDYPGLLQGLRECLEAEAEIDQEGMERGRDRLRQAYADQGITEETRRRRLFDFGSVIEVLENIWWQACTPTRLTGVCAHIKCCDRGHVLWKGPTFWAVTTIHTTEAEVDSLSRPCCLELLKNQQNEGARVISQPEKCTKEGCDALRTTGGRDLYLELPKVLFIVQQDQTRPDSFGTPLWGETVVTVVDRDDNVRLCTLEVELMGVVYYKDGHFWPCVRQKEDNLWFTINGLQDFAGCGWSNERFSVDMNAKVSMAVYRVVGSKFGTRE